MISLFHSGKGEARKEVLREARDTCLCFCHTYLSSHLGYLPCPSFCPIYPSIYSSKYSSVCPPPHPSFHLNPSTKLLFHLVSNPASVQPSPYPSILFTYPLIYPLSNSLPLRHPFIHLQQTHLSVLPMQGDPRSIWH